MKDKIRQLAEQIIELTTEKQTNVYEIIMYSESCPSETSSVGIYFSRDLAEQAIKTESAHYGDDTVFFIEIKTLYS